jgi:predicted nucleotidyltransferase
MVRGVEESVMTDQGTAPEASAGKLSDETVAEIVARVLDACQPERMILFGSAATGRMTRDSDIDILVVLNDVADARREAMRVRTALAGLPFPFDVIVMSRDRFKETRDVIGGIAWPAARYGRVIYEAA